jgi:hypothetical protein
MNKFLKRVMLGSMAILLGVTVLSGFSFAMERETHTVLGEFGTTST